MFWKQSEGGLETEGTCSAWAGKGQKGSSQSYPLVMGLCWWILRGKPSGLPGSLLLQQWAQKVWTWGTEVSESLSKTTTNLLKLIKDAPWHFWTWGMRGSHRNLGSCSNALTGQQYFELCCFVLYPIEAMWLIHLTCGYQMLDLRRERIHYGA